MRKEVFIAIFIGLLVGLLITVGMYRARIAVESVPEDETDFVAVATPESVQTPAPVESQGDKDLRIDEPVDELLSRNNETRVTGKTLPNTPVIILYNNAERVLRADTQGSFSVTLPLETGSNVITIRALVSGRRAIEEVRTVVYSTQDFFVEPGTATESARTSATGSAQTQL